jgi:hypothetical protein
MKRRDRTLKIIAALAAFAALLACMLGLMLIVRLATGIALNARGPDWEIWILVIGGAMGAGAARFLHDLILRKFGKFGDRGIERNWRGR